MNYVWIKNQCFSANFYSSIKKKFKNNKFAYNHSFKGGIERIKTIKLFEIKISKTENFEKETNMRLVTDLLYYKIVKRKTLVLIKVR